MTAHKIGFAAKAAGVTVETVRYYEREGLLGTARRTDAGYRLYSDADVSRLQFIRKAKALGFTLADIAEPLQGGGGTKRQVRERVQHRLADLNERIRQLAAIHDALATLEHQCSGCGPIAGCPIIEGVKAVHLA